MGAEIRDTVAKRLAPHRQYLPAETSTAVGVPGPRREWGLYPGEPEACRRQVLPFLRSMLQLGLLVAIFKRYQIEGRAFLALAALLIGICFLPVSWGARAGCLAALAAALAAARSQSLFAAVPATVWPVIATMFMFRLFIYMYELKHARAPETLIDTAGYFFLLPNF